MEPMAVGVFANWGLHHRWVFDFFLVAVAANLLLCAIQSSDPTALYQQFGLNNFTDGEASVGRKLYFP